MLELYKGKKQTFECSIEIEGSKENTAESRLIFSPNDEEKKIFFEGIVDGDKCKVDIPPIKDLMENGDVKLEIIVEDTLFSPWEDVYQIKEAVKVEAVSLKSSTPKVKVISDNVKVGNKPPKYKNPPPPPKKKDGLIREAASQKDKDLVKKYLNEFRKEKDKSLIKEFVNGEYFSPKSSTLKWARGVLNNMKSNIAKTIMYYHEN